MTSRYRISKWVCAVCAAMVIATAGCDSEPSEYPPPGKMRVVTITPLQVQIKNNLIGNGNFSKWWPGSPIADGFGAPDAEYSSVTRGGDGKDIAAVQTWVKPDAALEGTHLFRVQVNDLQPNTPYRLDVTASAVMGGLVAISLFTVQDSIVTPLNSNVLTLTPSGQEIGSKLYSADFQLDAGGSILIASCLTAAGSGQSSVTWREWRLYPVETAQALPAPNAQTPTTPVPTP